MSKAGTFLKVVLAVLGFLAALFALGLGLFWWNVRAKELPVETAKDFIRLEPGDTVLHAYTGARWLDSQRYFLLQADPAGFDERIQRLSTQGPEWTVQVTTASGRELWYRTEPVPSWWDVDALETGVAVDVRPTGRPHGGSLSVFSKERGLIYVLDR